MLTDYELANQFTEYFALLQTQYVNYISVMFAFLVASFLAADKLNRMMAGIVLLLFTLYSLDSILTFYFINNDVMEIQRMMHERVLAGGVDLRFNSAAREDFDIDNIFFFLTTRLIVVTVGFIGAIAFFFLQRRLHPGKERLSNE